MKAWLLTPALLAAYALGAADFGPANAAVPLERAVTVSKTAPNNNAAVAAIWERIRTAMCADAEIAAGIEAGECTLDVGTTATFHLGETETTISAVFPFVGTWTKQAPQ